MNVSASDLPPPPAADVPVPAPAPRPGDNYVQSFARGLAVLRSFGDEARAQTLSGAAARCNMTRAGARRILLTLHELDYVSLEGRHFRLTPKALELGLAYLRSQPEWRLAHAGLESLDQAVRQACSDPALKGDEVVITLRVPAAEFGPDPADVDDARAPALRGLLAAASSIEALVQSHD
ncbi:MAG TPA: helix-turn-helix domain-containing protein [Burkholderiaceae bacterium]|nr:helix-turn-helix domain-containing protein [Burkholderiaceae bacterium]